MSRSFDGSAVPSSDGLVAVFRDVTLREHSAEELERRVEERTTELTAANAELATFSYSVSHDLRAPLRAIEGFSHIVLRDHAESLDPAGRHALDRVIAGVARMNELIDALLGLSRVSSHPIKPETVDLSDLTAEVADELRPSAPDHPVALVVEPALTAYGDPHLLRVLMTNLLGNAWKFTVGRPTPRIEVGRESTDLGESVFFVRDNGAGFDMAHAARLFRPFERLHRQGEFAGTGVGLATVQRIVRRHGGRVWARAAVGEGATFFFTLGHRPAGDMTRPR
jgi:light-regulated signal transduction histidine kinase (bacteriophytochrome)